MSEQPKKKRGQFWVRFILVGGTGFVGLCVVCLGFGMYVNSTPSGKATNTARAEAALTNEATRLTPKPTNTLGPTQTPIPPSDTPEPTNTSGPTDTPLPSDTPEPSQTPIFAPVGQEFPPASMTWYEELLANKGSMTDLQFKGYLDSIVGSRVHLIGEVNEVHEDGEIYLTGQGGGFFDSVYLQGVPTEIGVTLNKGQLIEFDATIREFVEFIVFSVYLNEPVIYTIK
jgi:hypothetical protein